MSLDSKTKDMETSNLITDTPSSQGHDEFRPFWGRVLFAVMAGWGNRGTSILVNLVQLPLLYRYLDSSTLGLWFLMIGAQTLLGLFDLGFGPTLQRRMAFARGECGSDPRVQLDEAAKQKVLDLLAMARRFYFFMAISVFVVLFAGGALYQKLLSSDIGQVKDLSLAWLILSLGFATNTLAWYVDSMLNGMGNIGWSNVISTVLGILSLAATWFALSLGTGLVGLAVVWALRGILGPLLGWLVIIRTHPWIRHGQGSWQREEFLSMVRPSLKFWLAIVANFLLVGMPRYFIGAMLGIQAVPDFTATYLVLSNIQAVFMSMATVSTPLLSQVWKREGAEGLRKYVLPPIKLALPLLVFSYGLVMVYGAEIFRLWLGSGHFVGYPILTILCILLFLEAHHGMLQAPCVAAEQLGFYKYTLLDGLISLALMPILTHFLGLIGTALAMTIPRMFTDNWIIPLFALRLLKIQVRKYLAQTIAPVVVLGSGVVLLSALIKHAVTELLWAVLAQIVLLILAGGIWGRYLGLTLTNIKGRLAALRNSPGRQG
jgi:O-antigen/teichoic acid export membrane protein